jgi:biotin carboxyl carrier protein
MAIMKEEKKKKVAPPLEKLEIGNAIYSTRLTDKFRNRAQWVRPNVMQLKAVIPGTIQKVMVEEGDAVEAGSPLLILEAMKMRNEVNAPVTATVKKIHVRAGEMVPKDHLLIEFS